MGQQNQTPWIKRAGYISALREAKMYPTPDNFFLGLQGMAAGKLNIPEGGWLNCSIKSSILHKLVSFAQRFVKRRCQFL